LKSKINRKYPLVVSAGYRIISKPEQYGEASGAQHLQSLFSIFEKGFLLMFLHPFLSQLKPTHILRIKAFLYTVLFFGYFGLGLSIPALAQSTSYESIIQLITEGRSEEAEPLLKAYVHAPTPHPSAWIYLANIYYEKALEYIMDDKEAESLALLDTAGMYFYVAYQEIEHSGKIDQEIYYEPFVKGRQRSKISAELVMDVVKKRIVQIERRLSKSRSGGEGHIATSTLVKPTGKYYGLIVGVADYNETGLRLDRPLEDAKKLKQLLVAHYSFRPGDVKMLTNPTRQQILKEIYTLRKKVTPQDNLLIFFAGHGYWDNEVRQGYWWPRDAQADDPSHWLSNSDLREQIRGIKSAHTLLISDACFSGGIFKTRDASELRRAGMDIVMLYKNPSRRALTSGTLTTVPDQSVFFDYLYKALQENADKFLPSGELFARFRQAVINNSMVVPQDGVITETGDEGGDFIFIRQ
jgi:hypothetical protein